jgi:nucleoside phosphorylase
MEKKEIVILVPTEREAEFFAGQGLAFEICGVGMAECGAATARLLADAISAGRKPRFAIIAGIAGSHVEGLAVGDTVAVANETIADLGRRNPDGGFTPLFKKNYSATFIPDSLPAVRGNTVNMAGWNAHCGFAEALPGPEQSEASVENMEGAAFFAVCERFGVAAGQVRTISNRVGEPVTPENLTLAARNLARNLKKIIEYTSLPDVDPGEGVDGEAGVGIEG